jgi:hypothetical protein
VACRFGQDGIPRRFVAQGFFDLRVSLQELDGQPAWRIFPRHVRRLFHLRRELADHLLDAVAVVQRVGQTPVSAGGGDAGLDQFPHAFPPHGDRGDHGRAQHRRELLRVDLQPRTRGHIHHVQGHDEGEIKLHQLGREVQVPLEIGRIHNVDHHVGALLDDVIAGHSFVERIGRQGIRARKVRNAQFTLGASNPPLLALHRHPGIIPHALRRAGEFVEQGTLARVGIARDRDPNRAVRPANRGILCWR